MNFNFGEVLTKAWQIIWKHKVLWIFGILAGCGRGNGSNSSSWRESNNRFNQYTPSPQMERWFQNIEDNLKLYIAIGIAVLCIIWILAIFLSAIGKIGLIRGTAQADGGAESLIFGQLFSESMPYFWRIFALTLILGLPILLIIIPVAVLAVLGMAASGGGDIAGLGLLGMLPIMLGCFCLLVPIMFVLGMIFRQAENAVVLEDMSVLPSLSRGWEVFRANLGPVILMAIILAIIGFVAGLIIAIPVLFIVIPTVFAFFIGQGQSYVPLIFMGVCLCIYIPFALVLQGILTSYTESAWTLTYLRLTRKPDEIQPTPEENKPIQPEDTDRTIIARPNA